MKKKSINTLIKAAEKLGWNVNKDSDGDYNFSIYSNAGQDFNFYLEAKNEKELISALDEYIDGFDPTEEALKWTGPHGHGCNGAPDDFEDILADMKDCHQMMKELLATWKDKPKPVKDIKSFSDEIEKLDKKANVYLYGAIKDFGKKPDNGYPGKVLLVDECNRFPYVGFNKTNCIIEFVDDDGYTSTPGQLELISAAAEIEKRLK